MRALSVEEARATFFSSLCHSFDMASSDAGDVISIAIDDNGLALVNAEYLKQLEELANFLMARLQAGEALADAARKLVGDQPNDVDWSSLAYAVDAFDAGRYTS